MCFLFNRTTLPVFVTYLTGALYAHPLWLYKHHTIIEFVPNCLWHVSGDGFNGGSDSYRQFRDTCGKRRNINLVYVTKTWSVVLVNKKGHTYSYLKCIVYDKLLKPPIIISINPVYYVKRSGGIHTKPTRRFHQEFIVTLNWSAATRFLYK